MSDLHLEFSGGELFVPVGKDDAHTVLVLAGDIGVISSPRTYVSFIAEMSERFQDIIWIMGNHEYYGGKFPYDIKKARDNIFAEGVVNAHIVEDEIIKINDVSFVCATLWTNYNKNDPMAMYAAEQTMNDFKKIRTGPKLEPWKRKVRPTDFIACHIKSTEFIFRAITQEVQNGQKVVLVTHHGISYQSVPEQFRSDILNSSYVTELFYRFEEQEEKPIIAIHGHTHTSMDYDMLGIRVLCNPRGYAAYEENPEFNPHMEIEI